MVITVHEETLNKIVLPPEKLSEILLPYRSNTKLVMVKGVYDLLHSGHYYSFVNAKAYGDLLVVAVSSDASVKKRKGHNRPIINQEDRTILIAALKCVDWVTIYDDISPYTVLKSIKPNIFCASHFSFLSEEEKQDLEKTITFQLVPKLGENSTTDIIQKIKKG